MEEGQCETLQGPVDEDHSYHYSQQGFTPGSMESMRAVQMEHRYEGRASAQQQAACIHPVGRRNLAHAYQTEIDARNHKVMRRQLAGRRTAAALEWLLKRHQERQQTEQAANRPRRGAGALAHSRTSPNNPLCIQQEPAPAVPSPAEMVAALAALEISPGPSPEPAPAATHAAAHTAAHAAGTAPAGRQAALTRQQQQQQQNQPASRPSSRPSSPCMGVNMNMNISQALAECVCVAEGPCSCGAADGVEHAHMEAADDAVAVIADEDTLMPPHLAGHLAMGSLSPEPDRNERTSPSPAQQAAAAAYWKQQELEELMTELLQQYPHGIPKKMMMDLRHLGVYDAPPLGFGATTSSETLSTILLRRAQ